MPPQRSDCCEFNCPYPHCPYPAHSTAAEPPCFTVLSRPLLFPPAAASHRECKQNELRAADHGQSGCDSEPGRRTCTPENMRAQGTPARAQGGSAWHDEGGATARGTLRSAQGVHPAERRSRSRHAKELVLWRCTASPVAAAAGAPGTAAKIAGRTGCRLDASLQQHLLLPAGTPSGAAGARAAAALQPQQQ